MLTSVVTAPGRGEDPVEAVFAAGPQGKDDPAGPVNGRDPSGPVDRR